MDVCAEMGLSLGAVKAPTSTGASTNFLMFGACREANGGGLGGPPLRSVPLLMQIGAGLMSGDYVDHMVCPLWV